MLKTIKIDLIAQEQYNKSSIIGGKKVAYQKG